MLEAWIGDGMRRKQSFLGEKGIYWRQPRLYLLKANKREGKGDKFDRPVP
jgi:hypothetical protein